MSYTNRLIHEKSPYLLQHAHNPVDWYPWSEEAFAKARELDRPIFLSIGYATCHWCHVMEEESFRNEEVARLMNDTFINIKVDREEQPEVDSLYMEFAQAMMSGGAGWPLNVILTPDLMPFFASTYLPPDASRGFIGMKQLVLRIQQIWAEAEERESIISQAGKIVDVFADHVHPEGELLPSEEHIHAASDLLFKTADPVFGGTKGAPKFPLGIQGCFLLRRARMSADSRALFYVERTLQMMHQGGIYDHIGGGFARYAIDEQWQIPHFEKMLYDNAILARTYFETWECTRTPLYKKIAEQILDYVLHVMTDSKGGFYSAEDADSEGEEGRFYSWSWEQIQLLLGPEAPLFCDVYGVTPAGNFEGRNILHMRASLKEYADQRRLDESELAHLLHEMKKVLALARDEREHPRKDNKVITAWNGLMIHAFAYAGMSLGRSDYLEAAERAAQFLEENLWQEGVLYRRWCNGEPHFDACLDDYAFLIQGLLTLFEADRGTKWLEFALTLNHELETHFKTEHGAFYLTNGRDPNLILRRCEFYDGAEPSGNAVQAENLLRFYQLTGVKKYLNQAEDVLRAAKEHIDLYPPGACYHLMALQRYLDASAPTLVIALNEQEESKKEILELLAQKFLPHKVVAWSRPSDEELRDFAPICREKPPLGGKSTLYVCFQDRCLEPLTDLEQMKQTLEKL